MTDVVLSADSVQGLEASLEDLTMKGLNAKEKMIVLHKYLKNMMTQQIGIKDSGDYFLPSMPTQDGVDLLSRQKDTHIQSFKDDLSKLQQRMVKATRSHAKAQEASYKYIVTKKRLRDVQVRSRTLKKRRMADRVETRKLASDVVTPTEYGLKDYNDIYNGDESDPFDEPILI